MKNFKQLWLAFKKFYLFNSWKQTTILVLMLLQGLTAGIGLLFIIPLLQVVGFKIAGGSQNSISDFAQNVFSTLNIQPDLINVLISYIVIIAAIATLRYQLTLKSTSIQQAYIGYLRNRLYRSLLHCHWQFIIQHKMSDFIHSLSGQVQAVGHASNLMLNLLSQLVITLVMIILAMLLSWKMSLLALLVAVVLIVILLPVNRLIYGSGKTQLQGYKSIFQMLNEQLGSLKMIKSYASEHYYGDQLQKISHTLEAQQLAFARLNAITQWISLVSSVAAFSLFFYVAHSVLVIPLATILLLLVIFSRLLPQISSIQKNYQQLLHKLPSFKDIEQMQQQCEIAQEPHHINAHCPELKQKISVQALSYTYPNKEKPVFENLSFEIEKNETIALVGHSGAGKSTLADLIAGLLVADSGVIYSDETALTDEIRLAWRNHVAYVTQEVFLFHTTIRENLSWVSSKPLTDDELWEALNQVAADDFVKALPQGLDTVIGDRGVRLSGGERQRLALARALLSKPQLLILDEATSALDHDNELKIRQALKHLHGKLTILIIAHRETTIAHADKRIRLGASA